MVSRAFWGDPKYCEHPSKFLSVGGEASGTRRAGGCRWRAHSSKAMATSLGRAQMRVARFKSLGLKLPMQSGSPRYDETESRSTSHMSQAGRSIAPSQLIGQLRHCCQVMTLRIAPCSKHCRAAYGFRDGDETNRRKRDKFKPGCRGLCKTTRAFVVSQHCT